MNFLTSNWFMWVVFIFLLFGYIAWQLEALIEDGIEWDVVWHYTKKIIGFVLSMIFLPLIIIFGLIDEKRMEKKKDSHIGR